MEVSKTPIDGVLVIEPKVFGDHRGYFTELWNQSRYTKIGLFEQFVQDNLSYSRKGVLRGLHFQNPNPQGKLVYVLQGEVFDVAVDIRLGSPTFGQWYGVTLSAENHRQFYIPPGLAHGFCVTSDEALFAYKCSDHYNPEAEGTLLWDDPDIGIPWPTEAPQLADKDRQGMRLRDLPQDRLVPYRP
ncbi:dTDP-4-dehydrorhamnose 3,5-epimerase [Thioalkalivibrio sulfidiphilus]|uniref:dTDP-4-dehydrorhamnose 3,5-epimerase n=1 Tax=Thioalkalivibrio sulfidiphilus TaxID=1033854 RepID=UPI0003A3760D|nr:dTDP-4-dehydrorhamnose 3,5-epimerase [Thioalkalivibrio sulfidiphilus]